MTEWKFLPPYTDEAVEEFEKYIQEIGFGDNDLGSMSDIIAELALNHAQHDLENFVALSEIKLRLVEPLVIEIESCGVINESEFKNLSGKIAFTVGKGKKDLFDIRNQIAAGEVEPEILGPTESSKGCHLGTITIAALAQGGITLERGAPVADGLFMFKQTNRVMLSGPLGLAHVLAESMQPRVNQPAQ